MYTLILLTQYSIYFWHERAYTLLHFFKLNSDICGTSAWFFFDLWLALLSELYLGTHLPGSNVNGNKIKSEHGSHIRIHTTPYSHHVYIQTYVCKLDDKCHVNTDLPPLKSGEHKINNTEWAANPNTGINNLHVIYMILCIMRGWFDG